jgi:transposase
MAIKRLNDRHKQIAKLLLRGMKQREAAKQLNLSESHVSRVVHSPVFREHMNRLHDEADAAVFEQKRQRYLEIAMSNLSVLENPDSTTCQKLKAAVVILGRSN